MHHNALENENSYLSFKYERQQTVGNRAKMSRSIMISNYHYKVCQLDNLISLRKKTCDFFAGIFQDEREDFYHKKGISYFIAHEEQGD